MCLSSFFQIMQRCPRETKLVMFIPSFSMLLSYVVVLLPSTEQKHLRTLSLGSHGVTTIFQKAAVNMDNEMWRMWFMSKSFYTILCCPYSITCTHAQTRSCNVSSSVCLILLGVLCSGDSVGVQQSSVNEKDLFFTLVPLSISLLMNVPCIFNVIQTDSHHLRLSQIYVFCKIEIQVVYILVFICLNPTFGVLLEPDHQRADIPKSRGFQTGLQGPLGDLKWAETWEREIICRGVRINIVT